MGAQGRKLLAQPELGGVGEVLGRLGRSDDAGAASRRIGRLSQVRTKEQGTPLRHVNSQFFQKPQTVHCGGMKGNLVPGKAVQVDRGMPH